LTQVVSSTGGHSGDHQAGFDLAIVPVIKIICRSRPSSWSRSSVAHSRRNHQGLVADGAPPRNALPVDEASAAIQPNRVTIAIRNEALPEGKIRNTTKSALAAIETRIGRQYGSPRTALAIVSGASTPVAMINRNAIPWIQPCHVSGFPPLSIGVIDSEGGQYQRHSEGAERGSCLVPGEPDRRPPSRPCRMRKPTATR
jgi:hypothetical protein